MVGCEGGVALSRVRHDIRVGSIVVCTLEADLPLTDAALGHALDRQSESAATRNKVVGGGHRGSDVQP